MKQIMEVEFTITNIIDWIKQYFANCGNPGAKAVIGISGGKDSTIAAALLVRALGPDKVIGVLMPNGAQKDLPDAYRVCEILGIKHYFVDIEPITQATYQVIDAAKVAYSHINHLIPDNMSCGQYAAVCTNTPARVRMSVLYAIAAMVGGRVVNTGNRSEAYVGYTTKYGDLAGDFALLKDFTVREIYQIGDALTELPFELVHKTPADGMSNLTDENKMGFTYEELDSYLLDNIMPSYDSWCKINEAHERNKHKECIKLPYPLKIWNYGNNKNTLLYLPS